MQALIIITLVVWALVLVFGLLFVVFLFGRNSVNDNSDKAYVFIDNGGRVSKPKRAKLIGRIESGSAFKYGKKIVFLPKRYKERFYNGGLMIIVSQVGQVVSSPFNANEKLSTGEKDTLIYKMFEANLGDGAVSAIKSKKKNTNVILIAVVAVVIGAFLTYGYMQFQNNQKARLTQPTQPAQQTQPVTPHNYQIETK